MTIIKNAVTTLVTLIFVVGFCALFAAYAGTTPAQRYTCEVTNPTLVDTVSCMADATR